jgi:hypothetical protein
VNCDPSASTGPHKVEVLLCRSHSFPGFVLALISFRNGSSGPDVTLKLCGLTFLCNGAKVEETRINTGPFDTRKKCNGVIELCYPAARRRVTEYGRAMMGNRLAGSGGNLARSRCSTAIREQNEYGKNPKQPIIRAQGNRVSICCRILGRAMRGKAAR